VRHAAILLAVVVLAGCGGTKSGAPTVGTTNATTTIDSQGCHPIKTPYPAARRAPKPTQALDPAKVYDVTILTNCGSFTITLDVKDSPHTAASFASLVRRRYFVGTIFHRIVPGFVIQGGDPTGTGGGGPGYLTVDKPPASTKYTVGVVAMAKTQTEAPGTAGSQFFVVTGPNAATLPPEYAVLGKVTKGLDVAKRIGTFGDPTTEQPTRLVVIEKTTLTVD
jgi:cyclophilin family peptidyl-prolyl cis-trans isomerase